MEMSAPKISVIVPNYNHSRFLQQRMESIVNQTFANLEIILLDDCSTDDSLMVLSEWAKHPKVSSLFVNNANSGHPIRQWKRGIEAARGDWIWIAESDDFSSTEFLTNMMRFATDNPACGLIYCQSHDTDVHGSNISSRLDYTKEFEPNIWRQNFDLSGSEFLGRYMKVKNVIPNSGAVLFRRELAGHTMFDEVLMRMRMASDWLFWTRLASHTEIGFLAEHLNYFRTHERTTRVHDSREKVVQRLFEEKWIRDELAVLLTASIQHVEIQRLNRKWFMMHSMRHLLSKNFWSMRVHDYSRVNYLSEFIKVKRSMK